MFKCALCLVYFIYPVLCLNRTVEQDNAALEVFNNCKCVLYYLCDKDNYIITNGETILEVRGPETAERIICQGGAYSGEMICCRERNKPEPVTIKSPEISTTTETLSDNEVITRPPKKKKLKCGQQLPIINIRILGDDESMPIEGEFPWIAALFLKNNEENYVFHCSGSLIHPKVILTANHCVHRKVPGDIKVVVNGKITLNNISDDTSLERDVQEIINHPEYYSGALYNDIALLILDKPYNISARSDSINSICVFNNQTFDKKRCMVAGWGKTKTPTNEPKLLKKVTLPTVEYNHCQELLRQTRLGVRFLLHDSFMCAGGEKDKDACRGDGGSPLMCPFENNRYFQAGIVSWGIGCGTENVPGVYANVPKLFSWINDQLQQRAINLDT